MLNKTLSCGEIRDDNCRGFELANRLIRWEIPNIKLLLEGAKSVVQQIKVLLPSTLRERERDKGQNIKKNGKKRKKRRNEAKQSYGKCSVR